ncbi:tripartite tricarboxylate transporter substrate binding protein, partial [Pantoea sp. 18069]|uniref:tripartite tricarboxylate transporter substrate binding protein n=1 Tax=Pantoea sp. 18069 TaxID=2681415 RepID=UPI00190FB0D4
MKSNRRTTLALAAAVCALSAMTGTQALAQAQTQAINYPTKAVRIMVGSPPGGGTDILARLVAEKFTGEFKQSFVVDNKPGASNTIAADATARAEHDGHTLLMATTTAQAIAPHLLKLKFDPLADLQPIGMVATMPHVLVVPASSPYKNAKELLAAMKASNGNFKYASSGIGSTQHIAGVAFGQATQTQAVHVPYRGSSQALVDLMGGQVDMMFDTTSSAIAQIRTGKLRPLAVTISARSPELPDVPTLEEQGVHGANVCKGPANTRGPALAQSRRYAVAVGGNQMCGSSWSMSRALWVGSR